MFSRKEEVDLGPRTTRESSGFLENVPKNFILVLSLFAGNKE